MIGAQVLDKCDELYSTLDAGKPSGWRVHPDATQLKPPCVVVNVPGEIEYASQPGNRSSMAKASVALGVSIVVSTANERKMIEQAYEGVDWVTTILGQRIAFIDRLAEGEANTAFIRIELSQESINK